MTRAEAQLAPAPLPTGTFAALHYASFRLLWINGLLMFLAIMSQTIARAWVARELTGTNAGLGGVMLGFGLAVLLATPLGGVVADRVPKRLAILVAQLLMVTSSLWIGLAVQFDFIEYWMLLVAAAIQAVVFALYGPARMAFTAEVVDEELLPNAVVLSQVSVEGMRVIGPTVAGLVIGAVAWGSQAVFLGSTAMCLVAAATTILLPPGHPAAGRPRRSPFAELRDGCRYVLGHRELRLLLFFTYAVMMLAYPYLAFLPSVAADLFDRGSGGYGLLAACGAVGGVTAGLFTARRGPVDQWRFILLAGLSAGIGLIGLSLAPTFAAALVLNGFMGGTTLAYQATAASVMLTLSDFEYHGRVQGLMQLSMAGVGFVALPFGMLADAIGLRTTLALMGCATCTAVAAFAASRRRLRARELLLDVG